MKLTKMIYICSAYTCKNPELTEKQRKRIQNFRFKEVTRVTGKLQEEYPYAFIGPITQSHETAKFMTHSNCEFSSWARRDLTYLSRCDELWLVLIDGWQKSVGVRAEFEYARKNGIVIRYVDPKTLKVSRDFPFHLKAA